MTAALGERAVVGPQTRGVGTGQLRGRHTPSLTRPTACELPCFLAARTQNPT
jgi:hypothetical protein